MIQELVEESKIDESIDVVLKKGSKYNSSFGTKKAKKSQGVISNKEQENVASVDLEEEFQRNLQQLDEMSKRNKKIR